MQRLFMILLTLFMTTLAGIGVIAVLSMGYVSLTPILIGAGAGALLALPVTWVETRRLAGDEE